MNERVLAWEGCSNVRDLGGLRTGDERTTLWKAIVRSDTPARLTGSGWSALYAYGIRTIITLRTHGMTEAELDFTPPYPDLATLQVAIEDITDVDMLRISFERMSQLGVFTKITRSNDATILELEKEVNALLQRLGEKLKYNGFKQP